MAGRILYNNLLRSSTVISSQADAGYPAANSLDGRTTTKTGGGAGTFEIRYDFGAAAAFDTLCIARHNFSSLASTTVELLGSSDNATYTTLTSGANAITSDKNIFIDLGAQSYRYVMLRIESPSGLATFADVAVGPKLALERSQRHGFLKPGMADGDKIISNITRGRELAGLTIQRGNARVQFDLFYYSTAWLSEWVSFVDPFSSGPSFSALSSSASFSL